MNLIKVQGIRTYSFHGCLDEETKIGGNYVINIEVLCNFKKAAENDDLSETVDYVDIKNIVISEMNNNQKLIESVAYNIIEKVKTTFSIVHKCKIEIQKINPPINGDVDYVSVVVEE
jgi:dihydroneopterin aldolase